MTSERTERRLAAILSADVVGYSRLMADDEDATVRTLTAYREQIGALVREHRGRLADFSGDNFLAEFPTALGAVECAIEIQRVLSARNAGLPAGRKMEFRIGAHLGDVRVEGERIFGEGVNIAARLEGLAEPGGICISAAVHEQVASKLDLRCDDLGEQSVKNIPKPVRALRVSPDTEPATPEAAPRPAWRRPVALAVFGLVGLAVLAGWLARAPERGAPASATAPARISSLAVLPLENLSGDPEQEYFTDGMTEALISRLARIGSLRVISRTSAMHYKGSRKLLPEIARELNVDAVIEGSVLRAGNGVRITAQLIDARDDRHLWAESYERDLRDILALQSEVSQAIARAIEVELTPIERTRLARADPVDPAALEAYLRGRHFVNRHSLDDTLKAASYFEEAIGVDPQYALAWAGLAAAYS